MVLAKIFVNLPSKQVTLNIPGFYCRPFSQFVAQQQYQRTNSIKYLVHPTLNQARFPEYAGGPPLFLCIDTAAAPCAHCHPSFSIRIQLRLQRDITGWTVCPCSEWFRNEMMKSSSRSFVHRLWRFRNERAMSLACAGVWLTAASDS